MPAHNTKSDRIKADWIKNNWQALKQRMFAPVDGSSIAVFRIGFGIILLWDVWRYYSKGWVEKYYIRPDFFFKYHGFEWVQPWGGDGMYWHFAFMGLCAFLIIIGAFYRAAIILFTLAFTYVFLLDQARYLNHFYLVILLSVLLCVIPAHKRFSVDAWLRPRLRSATLPAWTLWLLRAQLEIVLVFAGLVKINSDWLQLQPLKMWLAERADFPFGLGYLFTQDWSVAVAAYGVIALHIIGAPLLLWKRTRLAVFCLYGAFHLLNHFVFSIGIFPWITWFASLLFFEPNWPRRLWSRLRPQSAAAVEALPATPEPRPVPAWQQRVTVTFILFWVLSQTFIPLRHVFYPGNVSWTEEGHRFSWQMKLRDKAGKAVFYLVDGNNPDNVTRVKPRRYLTAAQTRKMSGRPDMILQFAHFLAAHWREHYGMENPRVFVTAHVSLNGRPPALLIDPDRDLAKVERNLWPADWILPLDESLQMTLGW